MSGTFKPIQTQDTAISKTMCEDFIGPPAPGLPVKTHTGNTNERSETVILAHSDKGPDKAHARAKTAGKPVRQPAPDITNLMLATIFSSSLAGLALAGLEMSKSGFSPDSAASFVTVWALIASFLLVTAYLLCRQKKVARFAARTSSRLFWTTLACSCLTISATALAFSKVPVASAVVVAQQTNEKPEPAPGKSGETSEEFTSFKNLSLGKRKFSEHFPTSRAFSGASPFPYAQPYVAKPDSLPVDPVLTQEVQNKKIRGNIVPAAAKPDRSIKAEKPKPVKKRSRKLFTKKKKKSKKKTRAATQIQPNAPVTKNAKISRATPKTGNVKSTGFRDNTEIDCHGMAAIMKSECRNELK